MGAGHGGCQRGAVALAQQLLPLLQLRGADVKAFGQRFGAAGHPRGPVVAGQLGQRIQAAQSQRVQRLHEAQPRDHLAGQAPGRVAPLQMCQLVGQHDLALRRAEGLVEPGRQADLAAGRQQRAAPAAAGAQRGRAQARAPAQRLRELLQRRVFVQGQAAYQPVQPGQVQGQEQQAGPGDQAPQQGGQQRGLADQRLVDAQWPGGLGRQGWRVGLGAFDDFHGHLAAARQRRGGEGRFHGVRACRRQQHGTLGRRYRQALPGLQTGRQQATEQRRAPQPFDAGARQTAQCARAFGAPQQAQQHAAVQQVAEQP
eukprot:Opistho-2@55450